MAAVGLVAAGGHDGGGLQLDQLLVDHDDRRRRSGGRASAIPSSAFSDHTGITATRSTSATSPPWPSAACSRAPWSAPRPTPTTSTPPAGSTAGRSSSTPADDGFNGASNKQLTQNAITNDFSLVGGFSLQDSYGGPLLRPTRACPTSPWSSTPPPTAAQRLQPRARSTAAGRTARSSTSRRSSPTTSTPWARWWPTALGPDRLDRGEVRPGAGGLQGDLRPEHPGDPDRLHPERHRHEERRGQDPLHRPAAPELRLGAAQGPQPAELPPGGHPRRRHLQQRPRAGLRRCRGGERRLPRAERLALPGQDAAADPGGGPFQQLGPQGLARVQARPVHPVRLAVGASCSPRP